MTFTPITVLWLNSSESIGLDGIPVIMFKKLYFKISLILSSFLLFRFAFYNVSFMFKIASVVTISEKIWFNSVTV